MNENLTIPNHGFSLGEDMTVALQAAQKAGLIVREGYGKLHDVEEKGVGDLVSRVDTDCDSAIQGVLKEARPNDDILSEELSSDTKDKGQRLWVVDPLDATAGFLFQAGENITSVMVALRDRLETQLSVILFPMTGEWFYAQKSRGAFKNGERLTTDGVTRDLSKAWIDMNHYGDERLQTPAFAQLDRRLRSPEGASLVTRLVPHSGIVTKIIEQRQRIAAVVHDNNPTKVKQAPWDIIPAQLLLEETGGVVINLQNERIDPFKPELIVAAGNREIATAITRLAA
ncbi:inositol monophosphatase [Candidatus Peregrinibacteria bacterium]|nr:inositol monophosphatase [Candidatus Peregrinibacteria bacterium]